MNEVCKKIHLNKYFDRYCHRAVSHDFSGNGHVPVQLTNRICCVTFYLYQKFCSSSALDVTLGHVVILMII